MTTGDTNLIISIYKLKTQVLGALKGAETGKTMKDLWLLNLSLPFWKIWWQSIAFSFDRQLNNFTQMKHN